MIKIDKKKLTVFIDDSSVPEPGSPAYERFIKELRQMSEGLKVKTNIDSPINPLPHMGAENGFQEKGTGEGYDFGGWDCPLVEGMTIIDIELGHDITKPLEFPVQLDFVNCSSTLCAIDFNQCVIDNIDRALLPGGIVRLHDCDFEVFNAMKGLMRLGYLIQPEIQFLNLYELGEVCEGKAWDIVVRLTKPSK